MLFTSLPCVQWVICMLPRKLSEIPSARFIRKMADSWEKAASASDQKPNLWNQILEEVSSKATRRLPQNKRVLILGDDATGKTSLVMKLRGPGEDEIKKGTGLEYSYLEVHDEERDENTRLSVWILDGDAYHKGLLNYILTPETIRHILVMIVIDMSKPWTIMDSLEQWARILREHIHSLKISAKELNEMEAKLVKDFQSYHEPEEGEEEPKRRSTTMQLADEEQEGIGLGDNILSNTLGLPIVVVCSKTDHMSSLEKENDYKDEHFDFIQKNIRNFCLKYGAALVYLSVKEGKNVSILRKYLIHRIFEFPLRTPPQVVEKDSIFIPMGWDNEKKIGILDEHINSFKSSDAFNDHIIRPIQRKPASQDKEIFAEDEQTFLAAQEANLSKAPSPMTSAARPQQDLIRQRIPINQREKKGVPLAVKPKMDGAKNAPATNASEGVLANFFNSLLNKKPTGGPPGKGSPLSGGIERPTGRGDPTAELEKLARAKKPSAKPTGDSSGATPT